jgi:hypothetical protein
MRKICLTLCLIFTVSSNSFALDPKVKTVALMSTYGTIGGALLGTASLAFGAKGRAIPIGASLGLYAGLIFGTYVIVTHEMKKNNYNYPVDESYYPDTSGSPYEGNLQVIKFDQDKFQEKKAELVSFSLNFFSYNF